MKFIENPRIFPRKSIGGRQGNLLDTGIMWDHPGPGQVYLHEREIAEIVRHSTHLEGVAAVLEAEGWATAEKHKLALEIADQANIALGKQLANVQERLAAFETLFGTANFDPANLTLNPATAEPVAPPADNPAAKPVTPKPKTAKKPAAKKKAA